MFSPKVNQLERIVNRRGFNAVENESGTPVLEVIWQPQYDRQQIAASTAQTIQFFRGQSSGNLLVTNVSTQNMLPNPNIFSLYGISVFVQQSLAGAGPSEADWQRLNNECYFEFKLSGKTYVQTPFHMLPAAAGQTGLAVSTENNTRILQLQNGLASQRNYYPVDINGSPVRIMAQQDFQATLTTTNTAAFSTPLYIWLYLHGALYRPVL